MVTPPRTVALPGTEIAGFYSRALQGSPVFLSCCRTQISLAPACPPKSWLTWLRNMPTSAFAKLEVTLPGA